MTLEILSFALLIISTVAGSTWWLSIQFGNLKNDLTKLEKSMNLDFNRLDDHLREYIIRNDYELEKQKNRITALKQNIQSSLQCLQSQVRDIENFLAKSEGFHRRSYWECSTDTQGDFEDWTELK